MTTEPTTVLITGASPPRRGEVDVLVDNAGYWELGPSAQTTEAGFDAMAAVNFRGPFFLTAALAQKTAIKSMGEMLDTLAAASPLGRANEPD